MEYLGLGDRLKNLRTSKGLTQKQVAERIGIAMSTLSGYELEDKHPSYFTLMKLARLYGVTTDYLLGMEETRQIDVSGLDEHEINTIAELTAIIRKNKQ